jgi:hypothetical protein
VPDLIPKYRKTEFLKKAQQGKIENVAGSVWLSLVEIFQ